MTATVIHTNGINNNNGQTSSSNGNSATGGSSSNATSFTTAREINTSYSSTTTVSASNSAPNVSSANSTSNNFKTSNTLKHFAPSSSNTFSFTSTNLFQLLSIFCLCLLSYYNSTQCGLVFDDISAIRDNKDLRPTTPLKNIFLNDFWGTPMRKEHSHKSYRPLTVLTFRFNYWLHELESYGYHAINVVLHLAVCLLWKRVSRLLVLQCTQRESLAVKCSFFSTLLFAVHPIHTEAVTGVVGRAELLSSLFFLGAFLAYSRAVSSSLNAAKKSQKLKTQWFQLCINFSLCLLASMLCKEQGITIAGICVAYELFVVQTIHPLQLWHTLLNLFEEKPASSNQTPSPTNKAAISKLLQASATSTVVGASSASSSSGLLTLKISASSRFTTPIQWSSSLLKRLGFLIFITVCLLVGRVYVMGSQLPVFTRFDNPASAAESPARQLTYSYLIYLNSWLLLFPCDLCCDWTMGTVPVIEGFMDTRNIATLITFGILAALVVKACISQSLQYSRMLIMCLAWIVLPFLPASNLFFPVGFVVAERILYMPSMGFCLLIAYGFERIREVSGKKMKYLLNIALLVLLLTHAIKSYKRNNDWKNEYTLFMSGVHVNDRNAKLFNNVGHALENEGRFEEALAYFRQAVLIQPDDIGAHINVGRTYNNLKMYAEAEKAYLKAKSLFPRIKPGESYQARIAPNHLNVFINLANLIARNQTRLEEADFLYRQAISMRADYVQAYINRGDILMKLNRTAQAQEVYEKALLYDSENADIYYNLGVVFLEQGKSAQANVYFNKALDLYPEHEQALLNSAILLQEMGGQQDRQLSRERLHKVLAKSGDNEKVFFNLGMLAMDESDFDAAEQYFKRAIHIKPDFRSALFNLALLLADANRPLDAVPFLNQLIRHHSDHIKGLILLGDIYINHMKDLDAAESCYRSILKYEPHNIQGLHNLCVVYVERKHLARAQLCLRYAYYLAPTEDYILRHLQIVEQRLQKIYKLPDTSPEKQLALVDFNPKEFPLPKKTSSTSSSRTTTTKTSQTHTQGDFPKRKPSKTTSSSSLPSPNAAPPATVHHS
ncbi:protein O-mannosyl-transferase Tmtc3 [Lucilia cuprina]|uniref:protein O-mannosyl-transferase Tmtc3 n=1 Tax=Lucilia cuprina TaxID=7375 RepID=UPI001F06AFDD|nr:protein O-mannosyl-transferase Tmtc3 [Lucilia cuprina]XP_046810296.1 protein O-mannosyl-transferase Tmtc3 [Lucilia cuprina]